MGDVGDVVLRLEGVALVRDGRAILEGVDWTVRRGESWVVLGLNGSGKTSLVRVASLSEHPSRGRVEVLGGELGRVDVRRLRPRIGLTSAALADRLRPDLSAHDVVVTARHGALEPWWHRYDDEDHRRADAQLTRMGCGDLGHRRFGTLSSGERQRVLLARTLMGDPGLLLLDEPTAGLDLAGREELVGALGVLAAEPAAPPVVLVTHHVEEIPAPFTHALLVRRGRVQAAGPILEVLDEAALSACFGLPLSLERHHGRWTARAR